MPVWTGLLSSANPEAWSAVYLLLQGRRLVWFRSEDALVGMESGGSGGSAGAVVKDSAACGQILLCGHAGVTEASPVDIRHVNVTLMNYLYSH